MTSPEPRRFDRDAPPTDAIIGRAFRVSIVVLAVVAGLVGALSYLSTDVPRPRKALAKHRPPCLATSW